MGLNVGDGDDTCRQRWYRETRSHDERVRMTMRIAISLWTQQTTPACGPITPAVVFGVTQGKTGRWKFNHDAKKSNLNVEWVLSIGSLSWWCQCSWEGGVVLFRTPVLIAVCRESPAQQKHRQVNNTSVSFPKRFPSTGAHIGKWEGRFNKQPCYSVVWQHHFFLPGSHGNLPGTKGRAALRKRRSLTQISKFETANCVAVF